MLNTLLTVTPEILTAVQQIVPEPEGAKGSKIIIFLKKEICFHNRNVDASSDGVSHSIKEEITDWVIVWVLTIWVFDLPF
jgi:hypothetical protein